MRSQGGGANRVDVQRDLLDLAISAGRTCHDPHLVAWSPTLIDPADRCSVAPHSMPPPRGEGMTDTPYEGLSIARGFWHWRTSPQPHTSKAERPREGLSADTQPAPHRVSVKDLRPLRGRPPAESLTPTLNEAPPGTRRTTQNNGDHVVDTAPLLQA